MSIPSGFPIILLVVLAVLSLDLILILLTDSILILGRF